MRTMGGRPVLLKRFPEGAGCPSFFQKRVPENAPDWLQTTTVSTPNGTTSQALIAADTDHVPWAVNLGCLGFHVWPYLADDPGHTDELRIDLDPTPGVAFPQIQEAARELERLLREAGITGYQTTGNRGLHVYARLQPRWDPHQVRAAAVAVARELERRRPDLITAAWWKRNAASGCSWTTTRMRRTRRYSGPGRSARGPARRCQPAGLGRARRNPPGPVHGGGHGLPAGRSRGPWEGMNEAPQSREPLLGMSERDLPRACSMRPAGGGPEAAGRARGSRPAGPGNPDRRCHGTPAVGDRAAPSRRRTSRPAARRRAAGPADPPRNPRGPRPGHRVRCVQRPIGSSASPCARRGRSRCSPPAMGR